MDRAVYALFNDSRAARDAMDALVHEGVPKDVIDVQLHTGELDVEDLPEPATSSRRFVKYGTPLVALVGAIVGAIVAGWVGALLGVVVAALLGGLAAALSGSIDAKPEVRRLESDVEHGRALVIVDVNKADVGVDCERFLLERGALRVGMT